MFLKINEKVFNAAHIVSIELHCSEVSAQQDVVKIILSARYGDANVSYTFDGKTAERLREIFEGRDTVAILTDTFIPV